LWWAPPTGSLIAPEQPGREEDFLMKRFYAHGQWPWLALLALGTILAAASGAMAGAQYSSAILADGPIGYWRLGDSQPHPSPRTQPAAAAMEPTPGAW